MRSSSRTMSFKESNRSRVAALEVLPGAEIALAGIEDLAAGRDTLDSAAVLIAARRLRASGLDVPEGPTSREQPGHVLYRKLVDSGTPDPYSRYNAILRRVDSFARALEGARPR